MENLGVRGLQGVSYIRRRNGNMDLRIFLAAADPQFARQHEIVELLLGVTIDYTSRIFRGT